MSEIIQFLAPYEFSPAVLITCAAAGVAYLRGMILGSRAGEPAGFWRASAFYSGLIGIYVVMQTQVDFISQHMFWLHRLQHLILHHLSPFLIMLAYPQRILALGLPAALRDRVLMPAWRHPIAQLTYNSIQFWPVALFLFVGLIFFWLVPSIHFDAMLSLPLYQAMNWSMALDGLLFWWLILNPRPRSHGGLGYGKRIVMLWFAILPQIALGAHIALSPTVLYDVYGVCGRAWPISPLVDQQLGGLLTWIPPAMMSVVAALVVLRLWLRDNARKTGAPVHEAAATASNR